MRRSCVPDKKKGPWQPVRPLSVRAYGRGAAKSLWDDLMRLRQIKEQRSLDAEGERARAAEMKEKTGRYAEQGRNTGTKKNRSCDRFFPKIIRRLLGRSGFSRLCISGRSGSVSRLSVSSRSSGVSRLGSVSSRSGVSRLCISSRSSSGRSFSSRSSCRCRSFFLLAASSQGNSQQRSDQQSLFHEYSFNI